MGPESPVASVMWPFHYTLSHMPFLSISSLVNFVCHTCFKRQEKLHRCGQCKFAHYCDRTCQKDAWLNHKNECSAIKRHGKVPNENIRSEPGLGVPKCQLRGGRDSIPRPQDTRLGTDLPGASEAGCGDFLDFV